MKKINGLWIDENNNNWDCSIYSEKEAIEASNSLTNCRDCRNCSYCRNCSDFKTNPQRYTGLKMGSRNVQTTTYWTRERIQVICGCYTGDLEDFETRVNEVYKSGEYREQYNEYIKIVHLIIEQENK